MKLLKTYYINCENNHINAELGRSFIQRLCKADSHAYAIFIEGLSNIYYYSQVMYEDGIQTPVHASIILHKNEFYKKEDPETNFDRIDFLIKNFKEPDNPIILSVYEKQTSDIITPYHMDKIWSTKDIHDPSNSEDYVTIQKVEDTPQLERRGSMYDIYNRIISWLEYYNIKYIEFDYSCKISFVHQKLLKAKFHISYTGATYYLAALTNTPTLAYGTSFSPAQTDDYIIKNGKNKGLRTKWGYINTAPNKIIHFRGDRLYEDNQQYVENIGALEKDNEQAVFIKTLKNHFYI